MGTAVRIDEMARDLIRLSGFEPDIDIPIIYIGLRPGEKLYEELITEGEGIQETQHEDIMVLNCDNGSCLSEINKQIEELVRLAEACDAEGIRKALKHIVPEYTPWTSQGEIVQSVSTECPAPARLFQAEVVSETIHSTPSTSSEQAGRGRRTEDRRQRTEDRRQRTEDRRRKTEDRRQVG
jgi:hypothetical protein